MTATLERDPLPASASASAPEAGSRWVRLLPALVAAALAAAYLIVSPPSLDLAAHLFRAQLFSDEGFGIWNNYWYAGHHIVGYSVLFPPVSAALTPQLAAAVAAVATAALFEPLARRHFGPRAWLGAVVFGAATATDLYTGRLAFAFGALPALGAILALDSDWTVAACGLALLAALCSPVAALFAALAASAYSISALITHRRASAALPGAAVVAAALTPIGVLAIAFPEGGSEPFGLLTLLPILLICIVALMRLPREAFTLRVGVAVYAAVMIVVYLVPSPIGSNIARLGSFLAAPLAVVVWWRRRTLLLAVVVLPLLWVGWEAPVRDVSSAAGDSSTSTSYYRPLLRFLAAQPGGRERLFRTEIPFTHFHWEAYVVASHFPIARGWERQLDLADNSIFYSGHLTAASYESWLHQNAVRFVAAPDAALDYSAQGEMALIRRGLPYLRLVMRSRHWRVYAVADPTPIADGTARLDAMGPDWLSLTARSPGTTIIHVRFTPYWALSEGAGCVAPDGPYTRLTVRRAGPVRLVTKFSLGRIRATSPRCT